MLNWDDPLAPMPAQTPAPSKPAPDAPAASPQPLRNRWTKPCRCVRPGPTPR